MKARHRGRNVQAQFQPDFSLPCSLRLWHLEKYHPALTGTQSMPIVCVWGGVSGTFLDNNLQGEPMILLAFFAGARKGLPYGCMDNSNAAASKNPCQCRQWLVKAVSLKFPGSTCSQLCVRVPSSPSNCQEGLWILYLSQLLKPSKSPYLIHLV